MSCSAKLIQMEFKFYHTNLKISVAQFSFRAGFHNVRASLPSCTSVLSSCSFTQPPHIELHKAPSHHSQSRSACQEMLAKSPQLSLPYLLLMSALRYTNPCHYQSALSHRFKPELFFSVVVVFSATASFFLLFFCIQCFIGST